MIKTMKEDYVSFEIAKLLKEKGFHELCHCNYHCYGFFYQHKEKDYNGKNYEKLDSEWYSAPTLQMAMKWLREVHKIIVTIDYDEYELTSDKKEVGYGWNIQKIENPTKYLKISEHVFDTYEESCEDAIKYCLTNLI